MHFSIRKRSYFKPKEWFIKGETIVDNLGREIKVRGKSHIEYLINEQLYNNKKYENIK